MGSMTEKRRALAELAAQRDREGRVGRILMRSALVLVLLLLVAPVVLWACGFFTTPQPVAEMRQLVDRQVAEYDRVARGEVPFASAPGSDAVFEKLREMPRDLRDQAGREMGRLWEARERAELGSYFALPPQERQAELDRRIKAEEDLRRKWQEARERREQERARAGQSATAAGGQGGDVRGPAGTGPPGGPGGATGNAPGGGGPRVAATEDVRHKRMKRRIDRTSPEERAWQAEYRRALEARREQLGLQASGGRRGG